jgi:hypothetical protein
MYSTYSGCTPSTNSTLTNATNGSVTVTCVGDGNHTNSSCTATLNRAVGSFSCSNRTYNGSSQTACSCSGGTMSGTISATNAATNLTAYCTPDSNHTIDGSTSAVSRTWNMNKAQSYIICINPKFNNSTQKIATSIGCTITMGDTGDHVGAYRVSCTPINSNYKPYTDVRCRVLQAACSCTGFFQSDNTDGTFTNYCFTNVLSSYGNETACRNAGYYWAWQSQKCYRNRTIKDECT